MTKRFINILPFLIITILCIGGVEMFYGVLEKKLMQSGRTPMKKVKENSIERPESLRAEKAHDYKIVLTRNIFKAFVDVPQKKEKKKDITPLEKLEETTLDVILLGTITGADGDLRAIVYDKSTKKQDLYLIGDSIQDAVVKKIIRGKVVLNYNGKDEKLDMSNSKEYRPPAISVSPSVRQRKVMWEPSAPKENRPKPVKVTRSRRVIPERKAPVVY